MTTITLLTQDACGYCSHAKEVLARVARDHPIHVEEIPLASREGSALAAEHGIVFAPGVLVDGEVFSYGRLSEKKLLRKLSAAIPDATA